VYEKALCVELANRGPHLSIFQFICVHSRSFAAKKKISSKAIAGKWSARLGRISVRIQDAATGA